MENTDKILTISIAAYNVETYLEKTLSSLICSEEVMRKMDVIIVDDGSTDDTFKIAEKYEKKYPDTFKVIKKENGGHGSTLNVSAMNAKGKYFKMLDGDDWYETKELEKLVLYLEKIDVDIVLSPYSIIYVNDGKKDIINRHGMEAGKIYNIRELNSSLIDKIHAHELTVKTNILKNNNFRIREKCAYTDAEYVFWTVMYAHTYMKLPFNVYRYQIGIGGQTVSIEGRKKHYQDAYKTVIDMEKMLSARENDIICNFQRICLYEFIRLTADYQLNTYYIADEEEKIRENVDRLINGIMSENKEFGIYYEEKSEEYITAKQILKLSDEIGKEGCYIWGTGNYGKKVYDVFNAYNNIIAFVDNNEKSWGEKIGNANVLSPQLLKHIYNNELIIIAVKKYSEEIRKQLADMKVPTDRIRSI